eukprot:evm.model.scf_1249.2 EVM.evm.TU.scf_1249.2   scf_1249:9134-13696(+)
MRAGGLATSDNPIEDGSCDLCSCALVDALVSPFNQSGFDLEAAGGFAGAETALRSCIGVLALPLAQAGVPLSALLGLAECGYTKEKFPDCVKDFVPEVQPEPPANENCGCSSDLQPVCDYNHNWYTNLCVSKCRGVKLVESCVPVFKEVEVIEKPFVLTDLDGPLIWKAGCACTQKMSSFKPVCDINGKQYSSECFANCQGITAQFDCTKLVVDFEPSGDGPLVEAFEGDSDGDSSSKPDVGDTNGTKTPPTSPKAGGPTAATPPPSPPKKPDKGGNNPTIPRPEPPTKKPDPKDVPPISPDVAALLDQFGIRVDQLPPEFTRVAFKIFNGEQITDAELARAREVLADEEALAAVREQIDPLYVQQLDVLAASATGNNAILLKELTAALSQRTDGNEKTEHERCIASCRSGNEVCNKSTGEKYPSSCHARCKGVNDFVACSSKKDKKSAAAAMV